MYTLFQVKNCFNKIILLLLLLLKNSINRYLIKKIIIRNLFIFFLFILFLMILMREGDTPLNLYTHNLWATRRLEMQKLDAGWGGAVVGVRGASRCGVSGAGGGGISLLTEAKRYRASLAGSR